VIVTSLDAWFDGSLAPTAVGEYRSAMEPTESPQLVKKSIMVPLTLWDRLQAHAIAQSVKEGRVVSMSEALRRILDDAVPKGRTR
jgi:hypothetical protein